MGDDVDVVEVDVSHLKHALNSALRVVHQSGWGRDTTVSGGDLGPAELLPAPQALFGLRRQNSPSTRSAAAVGEGGTRCLDLSGLF